MPPEAEQDEIYSLVIGEAEMRNREGSRVLLGLPAEVSMGDGLDDPTLWAPDRRTSAFLDYLWGTTFCWLSPPNARGYSHAFGKGVRTGTFEVLPVAPKTLHLRLSRIAFDATRTRAHVTLETANPALLFSAGWSVFLERSPAGSWRVASSELAWIT